MEACLTGEEHGATSSESVLDWVCLMWGCFRCWLPHCLEKREYNLTAARMYVPLSASLAGLTSSGKCLLRRSIERPGGLGSSWLQRNLFARKHQSCLNQLRGLTRKSIQP